MKVPSLPPYTLACLCASKDRFFYVRCYEKPDDIVDVQQQTLLDHFAAGTMYFSNKNRFPRKA